MYKYFSGEIVQLGDLITTDNGFDTDIILFLITDESVLKDYGLDCFGALMYSSSVNGMIFISFDELASQSTKLLKSCVIEKERGNRSINFKHIKEISEDSGELRASIMQVLVNLKNNDYRGNSFIL